MADFWLVVLSVAFGFAAIWGWRITHPRDVWTWPDREDNDEFHAPRYPWHWIESDYRETD